ncbi:hypothetical protein A2U01_0063022, partial [Trifolium medium]|nr:hypothetical protein [Trifolium medium]
MKANQNRARRRAQMMDGKRNEPEASIYSGKCTKRSKINGKADNQKLQHTDTAKAMEKGTGKTC